MLRETIVTAFFVTAVPSQARTWTIDRNNGPGTDFTTIQAAISAASEGDILVVRPGSYPGNLVIDKGLTILAQPGVGVEPLDSRQPTLVVRDLRINATAYVRGLGVRSDIGAAAMHVLNCRGRVHIDGCSIVGGAVGPIGAPGLTVETTTATTLTRSSVYGYPALGAGNSHILILESSLNGGDWCGLSWCYSSAPAIIASDSTLMIGGSPMRGGNGGMTGRSSIPNREAILGFQCHLTISGGSGVAISAGSGAYSVHGIELRGGTLTIDPAIAVTGYGSAGPIGGNHTLNQRPLPMLTASDATVGGTMVTTLRSAPARHFVIAVSQVSDPVHLALGTLMVDPNLIAPITYGIQNSAMQTQMSIPIPNATELRGSILGLQALTIDPATTFAELSNAAVLVIH